MKDRRVVSLERVLSRRKTLERKLNDALLVLRGEQQALEGALTQCRQAVDQQSLVLLEQNRARIDIYAKRRDKLCREIETAVEDAQDEEASESRRPGPRPF